MEVEGVELKLIDITWITANYRIEYYDKCISVHCDHQHLQPTLAVANFAPSIYSKHANMHSTKDLRSARDIMSNTIRLNMDALELSVLNNSRISLASVVTKNCCSWELEIEGAGEFAGRITEEADTGAGLLVKGLAPGIHTVIVY
jgi:hypothetical protein